MLPRELRWSAAFASALLLLGCPSAPPGVACTIDPPTWQAWEATGSVARTWEELALHAIRKDLPVPTVHARNLFHLSAAMYDAWAAYDGTARGVFVTEKLRALDVTAARREAISFAAYRVLLHRYAGSAGGAEASACLEVAMQRLGYDPARTDTHGTTPAALGNRVAAQLIAAGLADGSNEANGYADTTGWVAENEPLRPDVPGTYMRSPDHWQPLQFTAGFTQNGIAQGAGVQPYMGAQWRDVTPFAMTRAGGAPYHDAGAPPATADAAMKGWLVELVRKQAAFDPASPETVDLSPGARGDNPVGTNDGHGHPLNPATGQPYAPNVVPLADFGRVLAEFWADGPHSETPPGHWNLIANQVADTPGFERRPGGQGEPLGRLEWDVKVYLALNGALHDAAITAWEVKREFTTARPISLIRWAGGQGQCSDAAGPSYAAIGLPLVPGLIELVTAASSAPGQRHEALAASVGQVAVRAWRGDLDPGAVNGVAWRLAGEWAPYQRSTFVTPAFPGFISGHSTFSRAAAEVLAGVTGTPYFPGGLLEYVVPAGTGLSFERGPSVEVRLQWATYFDAADQAGQSRLWGGIHLEPDDLVGRRLGQQVGRDALAHASDLFAGR